MRITQYSDYALRTLIYLAVVPSPLELANIQDIADSYAISKHHLVKIVHKLSRIGLIETTRGKYGGIRLALPPNKINLGAVLRYTEADFALVECFLPKDNAVTPPTEPTAAPLAPDDALIATVTLDDDPPMLDKAGGPIPINSQQWATDSDDLPIESRCIISPVCQLKPVVFEAIEAFLAVFDRYTLADVLHNPEQLRALLR